MTKKFLNTLLLGEINKRLHDGEKVFNQTDNSAYAKYVDGLGICKFSQSDELLAINIALTLFSHLYFIDEKEDYEKIKGCIGWFWDCEEDTKQLGIFAGQDREYFCDSDGARWMHFQPVKKSEIKFWEDFNEDD